MAWQTSDKTKCLVEGQTREQKALSLLRGALIDEIGATDLYDQLGVLLPESKDVLEEIKNDELNHQGRLLNLIMRLDGSQLVPFNKGMEQEG